MRHRQSGFNSVATEAICSKLWFNFASTSPARASGMAYSGQDVSKSLKHRSLAAFGRGAAKASLADVLKPGCGAPDLTARIEGEAGHCESDTIGDAVVRMMETRHPIQARGPARQGRPTRQNNPQRQGAAEDRRQKTIIEQQRPAEPRDRGRRELGVAASNPAAREHHKGQDENGEAAGEIY